jgi:alkylation response protein AidB-like acyl-CoA dehydrogenase
MDFTLTDEQEMLRDTARTLLTKECPPTLVRNYMDDPAAGGDLWQRHLREWVVLGDGPLVDHALFLEEAGRVVLPGRYFSTSALFLPLLRAIRHPLADAVAAGDVTGTVAMAGVSGMWIVNDEPMRTFVIEADQVDYLAYVLPGPSVAVVDASSVRTDQVESLDQARRVFNVNVPEGLAADPIDADVLQQVVERFTVALAAEMVGVSRWLLDHSVSYARERVQFDKPIGSFQGLQWKLVGMAQDHERAAAAVAYAAMAIDADDADRHRATHVAKAAAGRAARHSSQDGMQVHGGIGYTWEHDLHLYLRRAFASDALLGPATWHQDRLGDLLFG